MRMEIIAVLFTGNFIFSKLNFSLLFLSTANVRFRARLRLCRVLCVYFLGFFRFVEHQRSEIGISET